MAAPSIEKLDGLKRKVTLTIPAEKVGEAFNKRLKHYAKDAKIPGFRPGKVPMDMLEKRFATAIHQEIVPDLVNESFHDFITENELKIAGAPSIELGEMAKGKSMEYSASFEVYPEVELADFTQCKFEKQQAKVADTDVDGMLEKLRRQQAAWETVERAAEKGDQVTVDFVGKLDGEEFEGGKAQDFALELGSKQMIPGFEDGLMGASAGETRNLELTFPEDYQAKNLAGKLTSFEVTIKAVKAAKLPEINQDFVNKLGIKGGVDSLRDEVKTNMQREVDQLLTTNLKNSVMEKLVELNPMDPPDGLVEHEIKHLQAMFRKQLMAQGQAKKEDLDKLDLPRDPYVEQAKRRVILGLLLAEVVKANDIKATDEAVRAKVTEMAASYQDPNQVITWYYNNKDALAEIEAAVLEEQAVAKLIELAKVTEREVSYQEATESNPATQ